MARADDLGPILDEAGLVAEVGLTLLLVTGATADAVLALLGAKVSPVPAAAVDWDGGSAWAVTPVAGGVLAVEQSGFADPAPKVLARLSDGGSAAVACGGGEASERFGCARDGVLVWDATDWDMVESDELPLVPPELRALVDTAWCDPAAETGDDDPDVDVFAVAATMAEVFTGLVVLAEDLEALIGADRWHPVPFSFDDD